MLHITKDIHLKQNEAFHGFLATVGPEFAHCQYKIFLLMHTSSHIHTQKHTSTFHIFPKAM